MPHFSVKEDGSHRYTSTSADTINKKVLIDLVPGGIVLGQLDSWSTLWNRALGMEVILISHVKP